ncbi:MetQ/NlpA family ABC transporter substrate-binding protein [Litorihabitans aurantiacus]|uniref:ABC transporter substrate-binding protein n=1 Tax=Litorihabitans aurantiacus TaxID=1930061 RepID=A0AA37XD46_9MICO|nr:MetQ/NlpA family ABC transporter substrate-binding protein [Litorihabitans aurantiacus]GMA31066.1 ABC transporter substrate-binding protein [Litorihabitans aurantiacus]
MSRTSLRPLVLAVAAGILMMSACAAPGSSTGGGASDGDGDAANVIRIGVVNSADEQWRIFTEKAAEEGLTVELTNFSDYQLPNQGLDQGELELNQFQHLQFLARFNVASDTDLTPIGATAVYPLGLYSLEHDSVEDIPDGAQIAIPNDETNQARALLVLQEAGLVELADGGDAFSTVQDVVAEGSRVTVTPVDAAQTAIALQTGSVAASIINNDFVGDAGLSAEDAVFSDDPNGEAAEPYINVWVASSGNADDADYATLVDIWHSPEVEAAAQEDSGGTAVFKDNSPEELQEILAGIEEDLRAQG